ncbi:MAG: helix-turn-helix domain-containing protein [Treponema sp.]|jgi:hypothetical protein|nr:helix-turn-helix domain-containing protein [Treponema sp.]
MKKIFFMTLSTGGSMEPKNGNSSQALLLANEGCTDEQIAEKAGRHCRAIEDLQRRFVEDGFETTLEGKAQGHRPRILTGEDEARLIALVCGPARIPLPVEPGKPACFDTEYVRNGTCDIFMFVAPLEGWRRAEIREQL